jgi:putrescine importer
LYWCETWRFGFDPAPPSRTQIPRNNILLAGGLALAGAFLMNYQLGAELLNFGAFIGFMGVKLSALIHYVFREKPRSLAFLLPPIAGFLICLFMW